MPKTQTMAFFLQGKWPILPLQETSIAVPIELRRDSISAGVSLSARRTRCVNRCLNTASTHTPKATRMKPGSVKQRTALSLSFRRGKDPSRVHAGDKTRQSRVGHRLPWHRRKIESGEGMSSYRDGYSRDYIRHAAFSRPVSTKWTPTPLAMRFSRLSTQSFSIATMSASIACIVNNSSRSPSRSDRQELKTE
jgi:hypothetical protein